MTSGGSRLRSSSNGSLTSKSQSTSGNRSSHLHPDAAKQLQKNQQIVRVIFDKKAASLPRMAGSIVFASLRQCAPPSNTYILPWAHPSHGNSVGSVVLHSSRQRVPVLYNGRPFPLKKCTFAWGIWTPSNTWFYSARMSPQPKRHLDRFSRFCRAHDRDRLTNRQTDRPPYATPTEDNI